MFKIKNIVRIASIVFMTLSLIGMAGIYYFFYWDLPQSLDRPRIYYGNRIPKIYEKAGFEGEVEDFEHIRGMHHNSVEYTYTETLDGVEVRYPINFGVSDGDERKDEPTYSMAQLIDMYTADLLEDYTENDDARFFNSFFYKALFANSKIENLGDDIKKSLEFNGAENIYVQFSYDHLSSDTARVKEFNTQLKKDIEAGRKEKLTPLAAIRNLDPYLYLEKDFIRITIFADFKGKYFEDYLESIDKRIFKPARYRIDFLESDSYSDFIVRKDLQWENITNQEEGATD